MLRINRRSWRRFAIGSIAALIIVPGLVVLDMYGRYRSGESAVSPDPRVSFVHADRQYFDTFHGAIHTEDTSVICFGNRIAVDGETLSFPKGCNIVLINTAGETQYIYLPDEAFLWSELEEDEGWYYSLWKMKFGTFRNSRQWRINIDMESNSMKEAWRERIGPFLRADFDAVKSQWHALRALHARLERQ